MQKNTFGKVQFIWTHRNINECIPSFLSMVSYSRILFSEEVDQHTVAKQWVRKNGFMLSKALEYRKHHTDDEVFTDVLYEDLIKDTMEVIKRIYRDRGALVSSELLAAFEAGNTRNPKGKYGIHQYDLTEFGIDESYIEDYTALYEHFQKSLMT